MDVLITITGQRVIGLFAEIVSDFVYLNKIDGRLYYGEVTGDPGSGTTVATFDSTLISFDATAYTFDQQRV